MRRFCLILALAMVALCAHRACGYNRMGNDRILLMNDDTRTYRAVTGQAYTNTNIVEGADGFFWTHGSTNYNYGSTASARALLDGTNHVFCQVVNGFTNALWTLSMASAGTLFTTGVGHCFLPCSTTAVETKCEWSVPVYNVRLRRWITMYYSATNANCEVILLNDADASVTSPFYSEGIGTIYFDAVNSTVSDIEHSIQLCIATNAVGEAEFTAETPLEECDWQVVPVEAFAVSNKTQISKLALENATLVPMNSTVEQGNLFFRIRKRLQYFGPIRFRIQRATFNSSKTLSSIADLIDIDNIIASYPVKTVELSECGLYDEGGEGDLSLRGRVKLGYLGDFTIPSSYGVTKDFALNKVTMSYRSYNRGKVPSEWQTVDMVNVDGEGVLWESIWPLDLSDGRECIEYSFDADIYSPYYLFGDYTGCSLVGYPDDWSERVTSVSCSATSHVCSVTFNANGGSMDNPELPMICVSGGKYGPMPVPVMPEYKFLGWFTSPLGGTRVSEGETVSITSDTELFAHWQGDYWNTSVNSDGTLTITGSSSPLVGDVEIPSEVDGVPVTSIAPEAFLVCSSITNVLISEGVTSIGGRAFLGCSGLRSVTLPTSMSSIGEYAFSGCIGLAGVVIPNGVVNIGEWTFYGCSGLTSVVIENGVTSIGAYAFYGCGNLTRLTLPDSVTSIGPLAFYGCSGLTSVTIPQFVCTNTLSSVFPSAYKAMTEVVISDAVTSIGDYAFYDCCGLTSMTIPDGVTSVGVGAFANCTYLWDAVAIPRVRMVDGWVVGYEPGLSGNVDLSGVRGIASGAFDGCSGITGVTIPQFVCASSMAGVFPNLYETIHEVVISDGVTSIGPDAFNGCIGLTSVVIPNCVTNIGRNAFYGCNGLSSVTIPQCVCTNRLSNVFPSAYKTITEVVVADGVTSIGKSYRGTSYTTINVFSGCNCLTNVVLSDSVADIEYYTFNNCSGLMSISVGAMNKTFSSVNGLLLSKDGRALVQGVNGDVTIPNTVTSIGMCSFYGRIGLTSVTIGNGVTSIESSAFYGCNGLMSILVAEGNKSYSSANGLLLSKDGKALIQGVNGDVTIPDGVTSIGNYAFYGRTGLTSVTMPDGVTSIGTYAFYRCTGLASVTIPDSVASIGNYAFYGCTCLTDMAMPDGVTNVGYYAFYNCRGLKSVAIPNSLINIGTNAFFGCSALTSVTVSQSVCTNSISGVFPSAYRTISEVIIADGVTNIGDAAFSGCSGLKSVTIPASVTSIGAGAFANCTSLWNTVAIPGVRMVDGWVVGYELGLSGYVDLTGVRGIASGAFDGCSGITGVTIPQCVCVGQLSSVFPSAYTNISVVVISDAVTRIGDDAFSGCSGLTSVTIPDGVTSVGAGAFAGCTSLWNITAIPGVRIVDGWAVDYDTGFSGDVNLTGVRGIALGAFNGFGGLTGLTIPSGITSIGAGAFEGCAGLTNLVIEGSAFSCVIPGLMQAKFDTRSDVTSTIGDADNLSNVSGVIAAYHRVTASPWEFTDPQTGNVYAWDDASTTFAYFGQMFLEAGKTYVFGTHFDDDAYVKVDGRVLVYVRYYDGIASGTYSSSVYSGSYTCTSNGWYDVDIRLSDREVNKGSWGSVWSGDFGAGFRSDGSTNTAQSGWSRLLDPGDGSLFRCDGMPTVFIGCSNLVSVTMPWSMVSRISSMFPGAYDKLESITLTGDAAAIPDKAFAGCASLTSMAIPSGVTRIGQKAFYGCGGLTSISVAEGNLSYSSVNGMLLSKDGTILVQGVNGDVTIPDGVTSIGNYAFGGCCGLTSLTMPRDVASVGAGAFEGCAGLTNLVIEGTTLSCVIPGLMQSKFSTCLDTASTLDDADNASNVSGVIAAYEATVSPWEFSDPQTGNVYAWNATDTTFAYLGQIYLEGGKTYAFGSNFDDDAYVKIGDAIALNAINAGPKNVATGVFVCERSGWYDFDARVGDYSGGKGSWGGGSGKYAGVWSADFGLGFRDDGSTSTLQDGWCRLLDPGDGSLFRCDGMRTVFAGCGNLVSVSMPGSMVSRMSSIFPDAYDKLESITLTGDVEAIPDKAFSECASLTSVTIPDSVTRIGDNAFDGCSGLSGVTIPDSVTNIGNYAFSGCSKLGSVVFVGDAPAVGSSVFSYVTSGCIAYVSPKTSGWGVGVGEEWNGLILQYWPEVLTDVASDAEVVEVMGAFADEWIAHEVTSVAQYDEFRSWVGAKNLYQPDVVANAHVAAAYLLGAERLFEHEPTVEIEAVSVGDAVNGAMGSSRPTAMTVAVAVKDGEKAVVVDAEKVSAMLEATSDLDDWTGDARLVTTVIAADVDASGKMTFTVDLGDETLPQAFLRIKK